MAFGREKKDKVGLMDCVQWDPQGMDVYAYKFPRENLSTGTQLIVRQSQEAVFFSKGRLMQKFGPGKYYISTENIPLLRNLYGIPYGGKNPFIAEVWFVNKAVPLTIDWKTDAMRFQDPQYQVPFLLYAKGRYGLKIVDAERFLIKLVGSLREYTAKDLTNHFYGDLVSTTKSTIMRFMNMNGIGFNYVSSHLDELSRYMEQPLGEFWQSYGMNLEAFNLTTVDMDTSTEEGRRMQEAYTNRVTRDLEGYTKQQEEMFGAIKNAANKGGAGGMIMMGAMMGGFGRGGMGHTADTLLNPGTASGAVPSQGAYPGAGAYQNQGGYMNPGAGAYQNQGGYMNPGAGAYPNPAAGSYGVPSKKIYCARCGSRMNGQPYCPTCGKPYRPCPSCGADNSENDRKCIRCGTSLQQMEQDFYAQDVCSCGRPYGLNEIFCPQCGKKIER